MDKGIGVFEVILVFIVFGLQVFTECASFLFVTNIPCTLFIQVDNQRWIISVSTFDGVNFSVCP